MSDKVDIQVYLASLAESSGLYEEMMEFLEEMVKINTKELNIHQINILAGAYEKKISPVIDAIETLLEYEDKEAKKTGSPYLNWIREYKAKIQKELEDLCNKICGFIDAYLLPKANNNEANAFYHKLKGDYYRYICENVDGDTKKKYSDLGLKAYKAAENFAKDLTYRNLIKLGLGVNLSIFYYDVVEKKDEACKLAKEALENSKKAFKEVDHDDDDYKIAGELIKLLEENLDMWNQ